MQGTVARLVTVLESEAGLLNQLPGCRASPVCLGRHLQLACIHMANDRPAVAAASPWRNTGRLADCSSPMLLLTNEESICFNMV